jgi:membrane associated rhomboid family serine protease
MTERVTLGIIAITVVATMYAWNKPQVLQRWIFNPYTVHKGGQYYRFLSSGFIHNDWTHLIFNMLTLYFFGRVIEYIYGATFGIVGTLFFLITYLVGIIVANITTYLKHRNSPYYNSLGASGGVAAILFASIIYRPTSNICLYFAICIPAFIMGALYLIYSYYAGKRGRDNINHDAHLMGALFGIVFTILLRPRVLIEFIEQLRNFRLLGSELF